MKTLILCGTTLLLVAAAGSGQSKKGTPADVQAIQAIEKRWNEEWAAKDVQKLMAHYADDAILMAPGLSAATGPQAIGNVLREMAEDPALVLKFQAAKVEVAKSGDLAFTQGSYTMTMTDGNSKKVIHDHGSYVTTYRKAADGSWKAVADIATSAVPPPVEKK